MRRLRLYIALAALFAAMLAPALAFDPVIAGRAIRFPDDRGAHPGHRIEWWYITGQVETREGPMGLQVTFFRLRHREAEDNPSRFSPKQVLFAHAALSDPRKGRIAHDQRIARALAPLVEARAGETDVRIDGWSLRREGEAYRASIAAEGFTLDLAFTPTQPPLLQGERGFSRKGPAPRGQPPRGQDQEPASYYYSEPHLRVAGSIARDSTRIPVEGGVAWLDHEWSSALLAPEAVGWDWIGANLDDGGALMAFRIRDRDGKPVWAGGTIRSAKGETRALGPAAIGFAPRRQWRSPRTGTQYPVAMDVTLEGRTWRIDPLMDDQELDARASTGTLYWEGAVRVTGPAGETGRAYLELTGYAERIPF
jgi:predicted secreted hydrolase